MIHIVDYKSVRFSILIIFKLICFQINKSSSLIIPKSSKSQKNTQNIKSEERQICRLCNFTDKLKLLSLTDSKTFKLDTFKIFKNEYITFCLSINTIGLYCNKMLCFAHVFYNNITFQLKVINFLITISMQFYIVIFQNFIYLVHYGILL